MSSLAEVSSLLRPSRTPEISLRLEDNDVIYPYDDWRYRPVEVGASRHFETDQNLARAAKEFNLTRIARKRRDDGVGIWDGTEILFTVCFAVITSYIFVEYA